MRVRQKQIKYLLLFSFSIFFLIPHHIIGAEGISGKGKLQIKTDRLLRDENQEQELRETELDKIFPDLFKEETKEKLDAKQEAMLLQEEELKASLFTMDMNNTSIYDIKSDLFSDSHEVNHETSSQEMEEEATAEANLVSTIVFYSSVVLLIGVVIGMITFILRKLEF